jgi:hypothetical protein
MQNWRARSCALSLADVKARQSSKIREIAEALITAGFISLDAQAKALGIAPQHRLDHPLGGTQGHWALREDHLPDVEFEPAPPTCSGENP